MKKINLCVDCEREVKITSKNKFFPLIKVKVIRNSEGIPVKVTYTQHPKCTRSEVRP